MNIWICLTYIGTYYRYQKSILQSIIYSAHCPYYSVICSNTITCYIQITLIWLWLVQTHIKVVFFSTLQNYDKSWTNNNM